MSGIRAEILAIGDEILHGQICDTNSGWLASELERRGIDVVRITAVADDPDEMAALLGEACARSQLVIATGGLGPTEDDRTRHVAAAVVGDELVFDGDAWFEILEWFAQRAREPSPSNRRQALRPVSARSLKNEWGTAPGFGMRIGGCELIALPGVPREMRGMAELHVWPLVDSLLAAADGGGRALAFARLQVVGPGESILGERIADLMQHGRNPRVGITAQSGLLSVRVAASATTAADAQAMCDATIELLRPRLGADLVCVAEGDLPQLVVERLLATRTTLAIAESCTGGLVGSLLTEVAGVSSVFLGGYVTYHADGKVRDLGVPRELIEAHGEVSTEVAAAMAAGCAERTGAMIGLGVTGIAGPGGGTPQKPVGRVCFALSVRGEVRAWSRDLAPIGRDFVRRRAAIEIFAELLRAL